MIDPTGKVIDVDLWRAGEADRFFNTEEPKDNQQWQDECYADWEKGLHKGDIWKR